MYLQTFLWKPKELMFFSILPNQHWRNISSCSFYMPTLSINITAVISGLNFTSLLTCCLLIERVLSRTIWQLPTIRMIFFSDFMILKIGASSLLFMSWATCWLWFPFHYSIMRHSQRAGQWNKVFRQINICVLKDNPETVND